MSDTPRADIVPVYPGKLVPCFRAEPDSSEHPKRHQRFGFNVSISDFTIGQVKVTPVTIDVFTQPHAINAISFFARSRIWKGLSSDATSQTLPGTSTEVRKLDGAKREHAVLITPVKEDQKLSPTDIPEIVPTGALVEYKNGYILENLTEAQIAELKNTAENIALGYPAFQFDTNVETQMYPRGGAAGFEAELRPILEKYGVALTRLFGPFLQRKMHVGWKPANIAEGDSKKAEVRTILEGMRNGETDEAIEMMCAGTDEMILYGEKPLGDMDETGRHELAHGVLRDALPDNEDIQEAAAVFMERELSEEYDSETNVHPKDIESFTVLEGVWGAQIPLSSSVRNDRGIGQVRRGMALKEFIRIAGGSRNFLRILQVSKKAAMKQKPDERGFIRVPMMNEWLKTADTVVPNFSDAYKKSFLTRPMQPGRNIILSTRSTWGCVLTVTDMSLNPNYRMECRSGVVPAHGYLRAVPETIHIRFPEVSKNISTMTFEGNFYADPMHMYKSLQSLDPQASLKVGMTIIVEIAGTDKSVTLVWDEQAAQMLEASKKKHGFS